LKKLLIFISSFLFLTYYTAYASNSIQSNISENKIKFQKLDDILLKTNSEISSINTQIEKLTSVIKKNNLDISESEKHIKSAELEKTQLMNKLIKNQTLADKRLRTLYIFGLKESYFSVIFNSKNMSDFLFKIETVKKIASFDKKLLSDLKYERDTINKIITDLELTNKQLQQLKNSNISSIEELNTKKKTLQSLVVKLDTDKKAAMLLIEENEEKLLAHSISVIKSQNPTINELKNALDSLNGLLPQLSTSSIKQKAELNIKAGNTKLNTLIANSIKVNTTLETSNTTYKATYTMVASAYSGHSLTAMGLKPIRDPEGLSTIAVDPDVIALGTKVYIPGYGLAICADTGGSIKGNKIDIFLNSDSECFIWGIKKVTLHIIAYPGEW
jgi:3D (Asp-Asp-Asp) domain-containing protein/peptidoglycan hydrolase CwlO-like protein